MHSSKVSTCMMPNYLVSNHDQSDFDELSNQLNALPYVDVRYVQDSRFLGQPNLTSHIGKLNVRPIVEEEQKELFGDYHRLRKRVKPNVTTPWEDASRLPSLQLYTGSPIPSNLITPRSKESAMPVSKDSVVDGVSASTSGCSSDVTKLDVIVYNSPLDSKRVQGQIVSSDKPQPTKVYLFSDLVSSDKPEPAKVYSLRDLFSTNRTQTKTEKKHIVEPMKCEEGIKLEVDTMSLKRRNKRGISLAEGFTEEEIKVHIKSLKDGSSSQFGMCDPEDDEACQLCGKGRIMLPPPPIYCSICSRRIKEDSFYYAPVEELGDSQHQICNPCYNTSRSKFTLSGISITKANMFKYNNADNQIAEEWVQCEVCEKWQHQICGLYNPHEDIDNSADYICPCCLLEERKSSNTVGFDGNTYMSAKDLPETILSHFLEQRLSKRLKEERYQTAKASGKSIDDVSEPEDLTLRVVFSGDKTSTVNKQYVDFLHKEDYPSEFPYRSKVILLFQKVEGVDICIFALFVQEFGSECSLPNQRSVYIVYLDSVKYFRPERKTFTGEALRTFVYHEILIGYLEYCKIRGYATSYIWACPPPKGEDYIINSHPKTQQTPNTKKLRQWYVSMLDKAMEQRVATNVTNLYNRFFTSKVESTSDFTAAKLPYFEGSFWSCNTELLIQESEREGDKELEKNVNSLSKRKLKSMSYKGKACIDIDDAKKILLMQKLEKMISLNKEDFMVVELNHSCTRCSKPILSGWRWICEKCKNLQLCERCYDGEQELPGEHIHNREKYSLSKVPVDNIPSTTEDGDIILENDIFESRQAFLSFSQKNNYNFDTLRRAKHSSMMILYHLHTSNKHHHHRPNSHTCTSCKKDVSTTVYFPCLLCSDYRVCTRCFNQKTKLGHLHLFPVIPTANGKPPRTVKVVEILDALPHACRCREACSFLKCKEVKALFNHCGVCKERVREKGACTVCNSLWRTIRIHAYHCRDPCCAVPRCKDMKEYFVRNMM